MFPLYSMPPEELKGYRFMGYAYYANYFDKIIMWQSKTGDRAEVYQGRHGEHVVRSVEKQHAVYRLYGIPEPYPASDLPHEVQGTLF